MKSNSIKFAIPTVLTIILFFSATFFIIIKPFERKVKADKRELIRALTDTAWSILEEYHLEETAGRLSRNDAQQKAVERVRLLRYGREHKDYFWVTDMHPKMMVHPWRPELNGQDLTEFKDPTGKRVFVEFVKAVEGKGDAFVEYCWQWKDDSQRIEPKVSYVKAFEPWGWIVGTGVYMDDVEAEVSALKYQVVAMTSLITLVVALLLAYFVHQGMTSETNRHNAEMDLIASHDKYQSLVEASTEGLIMILAGKCVYTNKVFTDMCGYTSEELGSEWGAKLLSQEDLAQVVENDGSLNHFEVKLITKESEHLDVLLGTSIMEFNNQRGRIYAFKDVTQDRQLARAALRERQASERENLIAELQSAQLFMNQPVSMVEAPLVTVSITHSIVEVAQAMTRAGATAAVIQADDGTALGIVTDHDLRVRCISEGIGPEEPVVKVMTAPILTVQKKTMLFEAALQMEKKGVQHLVIVDRDDRALGIVSSYELVQLHSYSSVNLVKEISTAGSVDTIIKANSRLPLLIRTLVKSGVGAEQVTRTITTVTDAISHRLVELAILELGIPPAGFAFLALGSEGRSEQTLATDQDNVIVIDDVADEQREAVQGYFNKLGQRVCDWLDAVGYKYCPGEIMAKNEKYCQPLSTWKGYFSKWINDAGPQELLDVHIFFDFRTIYGESRFADAIQGHIKEQLGVSKSFMLYFAENCLLYRSPVTMFGRIAVKSGGEHPRTFDIKEAMKPVVNFARLYSIRHNLSETNTIERLKQLAEIGVLQKESLNEFIHIYSSMMKLRFEHQAQEMAAGREPGNHIDPDGLTELERAILKEAFTQITTFQNKISFDFKGRAV